jgi:hypothetical protein
MTFKNKTELVTAASRNNNISFDIKVSRQDVVDTVIAEITEELEYAVDEAQQQVNSLRLIDSITAVNDRTRKEALKKAKAFLKAVSAVITVPTEIVASPKNYFSNLWSSNEQAKDGVRWVLPTSSHSRLASIASTVEVVVLPVGFKQPYNSRNLARLDVPMTENEVFTTAEGKALAKQMDTAQKVFIELDEAQARLESFKKGGKRLQARFVREMLANSTAGKQLIKQIDRTKALVKTELAESFSKRLKA